MHHLRCPDTAFQSDFFFFFHPTPTPKKSTSTFSPPFFFSRCECLGGIFFFFSTSFYPSINQSNNNNNDPIFHCRRSPTATPVGTPGPEPPLQEITPRRGPHAGSGQRRFFGGDPATPADGDHHDDRSLRNSQAENIGNATAEPTLQPYSPVKKEKRRADQIEAIDTAVRRRSNRNRCAS